MERFEKKLTVVTGGNSGIGLAAAQAFAREGADVVVFGRNQETLDHAVASLNGHGHGVQGDVANLKDLDRLFAEVGKRGKGIDALFVNAGIAQTAPLGNVSEEFFDRQFDINVKGAFFTVQKALPRLNEGAAIVLNASIADQTGVAGLSVYSATKAAVRNLARGLSAELVERGIRVNVVSPGPIETPIFGKFDIPEEELEKMAQGILCQVPMKRMGSADEIAEAVLFLSSSASSYVLGAELVVDGGMTQL